MFLILKIESRCNSASIALNMSSGDPNYDPLRPVLRCKTPDKTFNFRKIAFLIQNQFFWWKISFSVHIIMFAIDWKLNKTTFYFHLLFGFVWPVVTPSLGQKDTFLLQESSKIIEFCSYKMIRGFTWTTYRPKRMKLRRPYAEITKKQNLTSLMV